MTNILIDTGFWIALYFKRDEYYIKANELIEYLSLGNIIIPYPCLYETINTRFAKNNQGMDNFKKILENKQTILIHDDKYKSEALNLIFDSNRYFYKQYSLVDMVIRLMLNDKNLKIDYLISFNPDDFIDVCSRRRIEILS